MHARETLSKNITHPHIHLSINKQRVGACVLAGLLTACMVLIGLAVNHIYPFGDTSIAIWDLQWQYQSYFGWLSNVLHGQANLFYSSAKGLGGSMFTLFAYYLASPFNLLAFFFTPEQTPQLIVLLTVIKLSMCAVTCAVFITGRFYEHINAIPDYLIIVFLSCAYALCGTVGGYSSNLMWIDGYYMLPLVALGVYCNVSEKKVGLLFGAVVCSILFNWYTAYMNCLFAILYFIFEMLYHNAWSLRFNRKQLLRACIRFGVVMALAVGVSMILLWPNIVEQLQGKGSNAGLGILLTQPLIGSEIYTMWGQLCVGCAPSNESYQAPLYIAQIVVILGLTFLCMRGYRKSDRKAYAIMCICAVITTASPFLNTIWTGFFPASSYINRQTYVFSFFLCILAMEGWIVVRHSDRNNVRRALQMACILEIAVIGASIVITHVVHHDLAVSYTHFACMIGVILVCALFIYYFGNLYTQIQNIAQQQLLNEEQGIKPKETIEAHSVSRRTIVLMCIGLIAFMATESAQTSVYFSNQHSSVSHYETYMQQMADVYDNLPTDNGFLRIEQTGMSHYSDIRTNYHDFTKQSANDDALALNVSSLTHYSSTQSNNEQDFFARVGYTKQSIFGTYARSPIEPIDKLLGVQYIIDTGDVPGATKVDATLPQPTNASDQPYALYRYDQTMPLGFGVAGDANDLLWDEKDTRLVSNPFQAQEDLFSKLCGEDASDLYKRAAVQETSSSDDERSFDVTTTQHGPVYLKTSSNMNADHYNGGIMIDIYANGQSLQRTGGRFSCGLIYMGTYDAGSVIHVTMRVSPERQGIEKKKYEALKSQWFNDADIDELAHVETLNQQKMDELLSHLGSQNFTLNSYSDRDIDATYTSDSDQLVMLSIPFDEGWNAKVDGKTATVETVANTFCGIYVHAGENHIQLHYHTPGLYTGATISGISIIIFAVWQIAAAIRRKKKRMSVREI